MTSQRESKVVWKQTPLGENEQKESKKHIMETTQLQKKIMNFVVDLSVLVYLENDGD